MCEDLADHRGIFNAGNYAEFTAAFRTGLDVDGEHPFEALHPAQGGGWLVAVDGTT
jgi:hypothetical protein